MTNAVIFEKWEGKTILNLRSVVDAIYDVYVCQCGNFKDQCDCPKFADLWKAELKVI